MRRVPSRALGLLVLVLAVTAAECAPPSATLPAVPPMASLAASPVEVAVAEAEAEPEQPIGPPRPDGPLGDVAWARDLPPLEVSCANTGTRASVRVYASDGTVDPAALEEFSLVAADGNGVYPFPQRLVQLAVKAAHHFDAPRLVVVSGYRRQRHRGPPDPHARGQALDFRLPGVDYRKLAAYLRSLPRVGVGVYTNPGTQFVHLDVRDRSFHWLDASPPGVTWREAQLADPRQAARDAAYTAEADLPLDGGAGALARR